MQGWDDFLAQQLDGAHHVLVVHVALVSVDVQVPGTEPLDYLGELAGDRLRAPDDDVVQLQDVNNIIVG